MVTDAVEDGVRSASQAIRHGRYAAEDAIEEAKHTVKQRPLQAMGTVFAAGVLAGTFLTWIGFRRRWVQAKQALQVVSGLDWSWIRLCERKVTPEFTQLLSAAK
jgi:hypothetical protein